MNEFMKQHGFRPDISNERMHHEIYLSNARKIPPEKLKTVIRHSITRR